MLRWLLLLLVVNSFVPEAHEAVELVTHYLSTGHIAHATAGEHDLPGSEHTCSPLAHHCGCCASQYVVPATEATWTSPAVAVELRVPPSTASPRDGIRDELLRPPVLA